MIIYKTTNKINGKFYIGKDKYNDPKYLGSGLLLNKAIKKYGKENFHKEILENCDNELLLNEREKYWILNLNSTKKEIGYNIALGGFGGDTFSNQPEDKKKELRNKFSDLLNNHIKFTDGYKNRGQKISESKKGIIFSEEHKKKLSESHKGKIPNNKGMLFPEMSKNRIGKLNPMYGKNTSEKQKQAVREASKRRWEEYRKNKV